MDQGTKPARKFFESAQKVLTSCCVPLMRKQSSRVNSISAALVKAPRAVGCESNWRCFIQHGLQIQQVSVSSPTTLMERTVECLSSIVKVDLLPICAVRPQCSVMQLKGYRWGNLALARSGLGVEAVCRCSESKYHPQSTKSLL